MKAVPIGELTEHITTWRPNHEPDSQFEYIDLSAVDNSSKRVTAARPTLGCEAPSRARQLVAAGDVLVSTVRPNLNAVAVVPRHLDGATASTGFAVLRPTGELDGRFLFHWVRSSAFINEMVRKATGASYPAVSDRIVKASQIPTPSLDEQRRIAAILDHADALRAKRRQVLAHLDDLTQSIFHDMFGDPTSERAMEAALPLEAWVDADKPITYGILKPGPDIDGGVPYVRVADMKNGEIVVRTVRRTTPEIAHAYHRSIIRSGDLLMSIRGHVGRLATTPESLDGGNITQDSARLAIKDDASAAYVRAAIESPGLQRWMVRHTKGVAVRGINIGDLRRLPVPEVPRDLQEAFAARVRVVGAQRAALRDAIAGGDELFAALQARAFRGEL